MIGLYWLQKPQYKHVFTATSVTEINLLDNLTDRKTPPSQLSPSPRVYW